MKRLVACVAALGATLVLALPPAEAQSVLDIERDNGITWVHGSVDQGDFSTVEIRLSAPRGGRLVQKCTYRYSGTGIYRCGLHGLPADIGTRLVARIRVDGAEIAHHTFSL